MSQVHDTAAARSARHVAIIMDGNGRWARRRGLVRAEGHAAGTENIRAIVSACPALGISHLTLYAFSTENWSRPPDEVRALMLILGAVIERETQELHRNNVRLHHIGRFDGVEPGLAGAIRQSIALTSGNTGLTLTLAFNYGGRDEIVRAARRLAEAATPPEQVTDAALGTALDTTGLPDPDLIIRTAGEQRLSNFLIWQAAYSEYWFTPVLWPDFGPNDLREAMEGFARRQRTFGHVAEA